MYKRQGKIKNTWKVDGATFLNDVYVTAAGTVYFTDSNTSTIYTSTNGKVETVLADATLGGTNGILLEENTIYLAGYGSGNVYRMDMTTKSVEKIATDVPGGDGIVRYGDDLLVSNWNGQVYHVTMDGVVTLLLDSQEAKLNAADIEVIADKNLLLVPTFFGNGVTAYELKENKSVSYTHLAMKERDKSLEEILKEILPEAFAVIKETSRRFTENATISAKATDHDRDLAIKKSYVTIEGDTAVWKLSLIHI